MTRFLVIVAVITVVPFFVSARVSDPSSFVVLLQEQIQGLLKQIQSLQEQVTELKTELGAQPSSAAPVKEIFSEALPPELERSLSRGSSGDDVRALQKFLSEDKDVYPEGLVTGYYGSLTESAVKRWQAKHGVEVVGGVGKKTIAQFKELREQRAARIPSAPAALVVPAQLIGQTASTTVPAVPVVSAQSATTTSTTTPAVPICVADSSLCRTKTDCEKAGFFWYSVSCHSNPPRQYSCATSYTYCSAPSECAAGGWYWCRNSCYGSVDACLGQSYTPPAVPVSPPTIVATPATPAIPAQPIAQTGTTTVPAIPAQPATTTTTTSADTTAPSAPTNLTATAASSTQITLSWSPSTDNVEVVGYKIYRNGILFVASLGAGPGTRYYPDTNLLPSTSYTYTVVAYDAAGNISAQSNQASAISLSTSILSGEITIVRPVGGTTSLIQGSQYTVRWTTSPPTTTGTINIKLQQSNGSSVTDVYQIASDVPNNGSYLWTVPSNYSGGSYSLSIGNWPSYPYRVSNDFSIIAPTQSTILAPTSNNAWWGPLDIKNNAVGEVSSFQYPNDNGSKTTIFRFYRKTPADSSFARAAEFTGLDSTSCPQTSVVGQWMLKRSDCYSTNWSVSRVKAENPDIVNGNTFPASSYSAGEYTYYFTNVDSTGKESLPSTTLTLVFYEPITILASTASQSPVSSPTTFQWTVGSGWPLGSFPNYFPHVITIFDSSSVTNNPFWTSNPEIRGAVPGVNSFTYNGPALDPAKKYRLSIYGYGRAGQKAPGYIALPSALTDFWIASSTSTFDLRAQNLAAIAQAFTVIKEQLLGLLQELTVQRRPR